MPWDERTEEVARIENALRDALSGATVVSFQISLSITAARHVSAIAEELRDALE